MTPPTEPSKPRLITVRVAPDEAGARLDKWLSDRVEGVTRSRLKALIEAGALARDGAPFADAAWKVRSGEDYALEIPPAAPPNPAAEAIALDIFYEDDDLIVINKPAGLVVHPGAGNPRGTLVNALIAHCGPSLSGVGGVARPGIVHRIDKDTSGLLVAAKNDRAHQGLSAQFAAHAIDRIYDAVAAGSPRPGVGVIDAPLARAPGERKRMAVVRARRAPRDDGPAVNMRPSRLARDAAEGIARPSSRAARDAAQIFAPPQEDDADDAAGGEGGPAGARHAVTHYRVAETFGRARAKLKGDALASLIECRLETGRTHQIRVHLSHLGHPLVGDPVYGRGPGLSGLRPDDAAATRAIALIAGFRRQALHARRLGFVHPVSGEALSFEADWPADFAALVAALRAL